MKILGKLVDIHNRDIYGVEMGLSDGLIEYIEHCIDTPDIFILPGLIDSHIHIESTMVTPGAFGYEAVSHGTIGVVSDPHEIANVLGWEGVEFMIGDAKKSPLKFWFGAPSCVPATNFETSGYSITADQIETILKRSDIKYLSEMMNFPGVINDDPEVMKKLGSARRAGKPVDGHAPRLSGKSLRKYVEAGITTDHECSTLDEAIEKIGMGMKVLIREGSASRNLNSLKGLFNLYPEMIMLCSDDLHPEMLVERHINKLIGQLIAEGFDMFDVIRSATVNPHLHYKLNNGLLRKGDAADFILVKDLKKMDIEETWIGGERVFNKGLRNFRYEPERTLNNFRCREIDYSDIRVKRLEGKLRIIEAFDGELLTGEVQLDTPPVDVVNTDLENDILKIVVKDRYRDTPPSVGFIKGFGLQDGAFAGSIAHDSHNIICVGTNDIDIITAVNEVIRMKGGLSVSVNCNIDSLQLDIGGIMTTRPCSDVASEYSRLNQIVRSIGCTMTAPFMTLSFMALLVIPDLKIGDRGLFDVKQFKPVPLFVEYAG